MKKGGAVERRRGQTTEGNDKEEEKIEGLSMVEKKREIIRIVVWPE